MLPWVGHFLLLVEMLRKCLRKKKGRGAHINEETGGWGVAGWARNQTRRWAARIKGRANASA